MLNMYIIIAVWTFALSEVTGCLICVLLESITITPCAHDLKKKINSEYATHAYGN